MSGLQKQNAAFAARAQAASKQFTKKTSTSTTSSTITKPPASQQTQAKQTPASSAPATAAKKQTLVYSQPEDTSKGETLATQIQYAVRYLKEKIDEPPLSIDRIISFLSMTHEGKQYSDAVEHFLQRRGDVYYSPKTKTYKFRSRYDVSDRVGLLAKFQGLETYKGLDVKDLKEGWKDAEKTIDELEKEHRILVLRHKKDQAPRFIYRDDPSLYFTIDEEFQELWHKIKLPADGPQMIDELIKEGQQTTSKEGNTIKKAANKVEKPKKKQRRGGRVTNKHMQGIFKDFTHLRRG